MKHRWSIALWITLFCVGYRFTFLNGFPGIKYYPVEHAWGLPGAYDGPSMAWFGKVAFGCICGLVGWLIGLVIHKVKGAEAKPPATIEVVSWALVLYILAYTGHHEWAKWLGSSQ